VKHEARINILDVTVKEQKEVGFSRIKRLITTSRVYIAFAGGDGMLPMTLNDLERQKININLITFLILPFGSGNDLAQVTGWGNTSDENYLLSLNEVLDMAFDNHKAYDVVEEQLNIWEILCKYKGTQNPMIQRAEGKGLGKNLIEEKTGH